MNARALIGFVLFAGGATLIYELLNKTTETTGTGIVTKPTTIGQTFLDKLASIESSGLAYAKAATSSASGLFQFTRSTWEGLGGTWGNNPLLAFGGLKPSIAEQTMRAQQLVAENAGILSNAGIDATQAALYAAHFLGAYAAVRVLNANPATPLKSLISDAAIRANPFLKNMTVADFQTWLHGKVS